jgi:hypothetical protein
MLIVFEDALLEERDQCWWLIAYFIDLFEEDGRNGSIGYVLRHLYLVIILKTTSKIFYQMQTNKQFRYFI